MSGRMYFLRSFRVTEGRQLRHAQQTSTGIAFALLGRVEHHPAGPRIPSHLVQLLRNHTLELAS